MFWERSRFLIRGWCITWDHRYEYWTLRWESRCRFYKWSLCWLGINRSINRKSPYTTPYVRDDRYISSSTFKKPRWWKMSIFLVSSVRRLPLISYLIDRSLSLSFGSPLSELVTFEIYKRYHNIQSVGQRLSQFLKDGILKRHTEIS